MKFAAIRSAAILVAVEVIFGVNDEGDLAVVHRHRLVCFRPAGRYPRGKERGMQGMMSNWATPTFDLLFWTPQ
jgi:hypothetical protein